MVKVCFVKWVGMNGEVHETKYNNVSSIVHNYYKDANGEKTLTVLFDDGEQRATFSIDEIIDICFYQSRL